MYVVKRRRPADTARRPAAKRPRKPAPPVWRSDRTERCYALLDRLRAEGATAPLLADWDSLWRAYREADAEGRADLREGSLLHHAAWDIATAGGDHAAAVEALRAYFAHPLMDADDRVMRVGNRCAMARSLLALGREGDAAALYRALLHSRQRADVQIARAHARTTLLAHLEVAQRDQPAPVELAALVRVLVAQLCRRKALLRGLEGTPTRGALAAALAATLPPNEASGADGQA